MMSIELRKLEKEGFVINKPFEIGGYRYFIDTNFNGRHFSVRVVDIARCEGETIVTRCNIDTAINKVKEHIAANS